MGPRQFLEGLKGREEGFRGRVAVKSTRLKEGLQTQDEEHQRHERAPNRRQGPGDPKISSYFYSS